MGRPGPPWRAALDVGADDPANSTSSGADGARRIPKDIDPSPRDRASNGRPIAGPHVGQGFLQAGPLSFGPAGLVGVDLLAARGLQGILLEVEVLLVSRDPGISD